MLKVPGALETILTYHATTPKIGFAKAKAARGMSIKMLSSEMARIGGQRPYVVRIDTAKVVSKNTRSRNGVMHVTNAVMIPPTIEAALAK